MSFYTIPDLAKFLIERAGLSTSKDEWENYARSSEALKRQQAEIERLRAALAAPASEPVAPEGWSITRIDKGPFKYIEITAPSGHSAHVYSASRSPENILYLLADAMLKAAPVSLEPS